MSASSRRGRFAERAIALDLLSQRLESRALLIEVTVSGVDAFNAVDFGTLKAGKPANCEIIATTKADDKGRLDAPLVPVGCIGVWDKSLPPGQDNFNSDFALAEIDKRAQVWTLTRAVLVLLRCEAEIADESTRGCSAVGREWPPGRCT